MSFIGFLNKKKQILIIRFVCRKFTEECSLDQYLLREREGKRRKQDRAEGEVELWGIHKKTLVGKGTRHYTSHWQVLDFRLSQRGGAVALESGASWGPMGRQKKLHPEYEFILGKNTRKVTLRKKKIKCFISLPLKKIFALTYLLCIKV